MSYHWKLKVGQPSRKWREKDHPRDEVGRFAEKDMPVVRVTVKGGPGSGNFGHEGRPGMVGGSGPGGGWSGNPKDLVPEDRLRWDERETFIKDTSNMGHKFARYVEKMELPSVPMDRAYYLGKVALLQHLDNMRLLQWEKVADLNQFRLARASQLDWTKDRWEKEVRSYMDRMKPFKPLGHY